MINGNSTIGKGTVVQHGVTIGELNSGEGVPNIGKNCYIGARAILLGNITVGDNAKIGAGAVVLNDVPEGATAVGVPAKLYNVNKKGEYNNEKH